MRPIIFLNVSNENIFGSSSALLPVIIKNTYENSFEFYYQYTNSSLVNLIDWISLNNLKRMKGWNMLW